MKEEYPAFSHMKSRFRSRYLLRSGEIAHFDLLEPPVVFEDHFLQNKNDGFKHTGVGWSPSLNHNYTMVPSA